MNDKKTPAMRETLEWFADQVFGRSREDCIRDGVCVGCGGSATEFTDTISRKEFGISGLCQKCQDEIFGD